jgi:hypothetical protein
MSRTSADAMKALLGNNYDPRIESLDAFIDTASALVDYVDSKDTGGILTETLLERIECLLSAHYYELADPGFQSRSTGGASGSYHGQTLTYLSSTPYGQQAIALDVTGTLARINREAAEGPKRKVDLTWLGKTELEATTWEDRNI